MARLASRRLVHRVTFDDLCDRFDNDRARIHKRYRDRWVIYTHEGVMADFVTEREAVTAAFGSYGDRLFIVDQALAETPVVFLGGGGTRIR